MRNGLNLILPNLFHSLGKGSTFHWMPCIRELVKRVKNLKESESINRLVDRWPAVAIGLHCFQWNASRREGFQWSTLLESLRSFYWLGPWQEAGGRHSMENFSSIQSHSESLRTFSIRFRWLPNRRRAHQVDTWTWRDSNSRAIAGTQAACSAWLSS